MTRQAKRGEGARGVRVMTYGAPEGRGKSIALTSRAPPGRILFITPLPGGSPDFVGVTTGYTTPALRACRTGYTTPARWAFSSPSSLVPHLLTLVPNPLISLP